MPDNTFPLLRIISMFLVFVLYNIFDIIFSTLFFSISSTKSVPFCKTGSFCSNCNTFSSNSFTLDGVK